MDKIPGPHASTVGKTSGLAGYPISPLHVKRRTSSNSSTAAAAAAAGVAEDKLDAKGAGGGLVNDSDARYLPQLRRSEGRGNAQNSAGI